MSPPAHQVLAADAGHYVKRRTGVISEFRHFLGDGLLVVSRDERWLSHRRIVQPLFTRRAVSSHLEAIAAATDDLLSWCEEDASAGTNSRPSRLVDAICAFSPWPQGVFGEDIVQAAPTPREVLPRLGEQLKRRALAPVGSLHWFPSPANRVTSCFGRRWRVNTPAAPGKGDHALPLVRPPRVAPADGVIPGAVRRQGW